jgi:hypothetical protein
MIRFTNLSIAALHCAAIALCLLPSQDGRTVTAGAQGKTPPVSDGIDAGDGIAARGYDTSITWDELDELLLARRAMSKDGRENLRHLAQVDLLDVLGKQNGLWATDAQVEEQLREIQRQVVASGEKGGFEGLLKSKRVTLAEFRRLLKLAPVQETLTRRALGLKDGDKVTGEQQQMWIDDALVQRKYEEFNPPWQDGVVARCGEFTILQDEFMQCLRERLPEETLREDCWQLLVCKRMKARMPDLAPEKLAKAVGEELQKRRDETKRDPRYKGISYESLLATQGVMVDRMERDPGVQIAALSKLWVERSYDDAALQRVYKDERDLFDGAHGPAVDTTMIFLRAALFKNEFNPRTFSDADQLLRDVRGRVRTLDAFRAVAKEMTEDAQTKEAQGGLGYVTARTNKVPVEVQTEIAKAIATDASASAEACLVGPVHVPNGCVLLWFGLRRPAPAWDVMLQYVKSELRRRFVEDVLPKSAVVTSF